MRENIESSEISKEKKLMLAFKSSRVHYKQAIDLKKSGYTENDVMIHAYPIWKEDEGSDFTL